jgi:hypothetical protein
VGGVNSIGSGPFSEEIEVEIRIASTSIAPSSFYSEFVTEITQTVFSTAINPTALETVLTSFYMYISGSEFEHVQTSFDNSFITSISIPVLISSTVNPATITTHQTLLINSSIATETVLPTKSISRTNESTPITTSPSVTIGIVVYASVAGAITLLLIIMILAIIAVVVVIILRRNKVKHKTGILLDEQQSPNFTKRDVYFPVIESSFSEFNNTKSSNVNVYVKFVNFNSRRNS